jgi:hypothetical protein
MESTAFMQVGLVQIAISARSASPQHLACRTLFFISSQAWLSPAPMTQLGSARIGLRCCSLPEPCVPS